MPAAASSAKAHFAVGSHTNLAPKLTNAYRPMAVHSVSERVRSCRVSAYMIRGFASGCIAEQSSRRKVITNEVMAALRPTHYTAALFEHRESDLIHALQALVLAGGVQAVRLGRPWPLRRAGEWPAVGSYDGRGADEQPLDISQAARGGRFERELGGDRSGVSDGFERKHQSAGRPTRRRPGGRPGRRCVCLSKPALTTPPYCRARPRKP